MKSSFFALFARVKALPIYTIAVPGKVGLILASAATLVVESKANLSNLCPGTVPK